MQLSEKEIRNWIKNDAIFFRGKEYWLQKRVKNLNQLSVDKIIAVVVGSDRYEVNIGFQKGRISSTCSCPYEWGICKHVVAVLLQWSHENAISLIHQASGRGLAIIQPEVRQKRYGLEQLYPGPAKDVRLRLELISLSSTNLESQGSKARVKIIDAHGRPSSEIENLRDFVDSSMAYGGDGQWSLLNDSQQYFLNLLASFQQPFQATFLRPFQLSLILNAFADLSGVELYSGVRQPIEVCGHQTLEAKIILGLTKNRKLRVIFEFPDPKNPLQKLRPSIIEGRPAWCYLENDFKFMRLPEGVDRRLLQTLGCNKAIIFEKEEASEIFKTVEILKDHCSICYDSPELSQIQQVSLPLRMELTVDYDGKYLSVLPKAIYGGHALSLKEMFDRREYTLFDGQDGLLNLHRDLVKEGEVLRFILEECDLEVFQERVFRTNHQDLMAEIIYEKLAKLADRCEITISSRVKNIFHVNDVFEPFVRVGDDPGINWFEYDIGFTLNGKQEEISFSDIQHQLMGEKNYVRLKSGEFVQLESQKYQAINDFIREQGGARGRLTSVHLPYLMASCQEGRFSLQLGRKAQELCEKLKSFRSIVKTDTPKSFKGVLRDYQSLGLDWLEFLREFQFGGVLADDMGLGKTVQVLALLLKCKEQGMVSPNLVICPTTLVLNWQAEAEKFTPDLKVLVLTGKDRRGLIPSISQYDVVLTSYAIMRRDMEFYEKQKFYYIILDEAQHIKNRHTLNARMAKSLVSTNRLVLTGTPIENSIADLWSIFDFLMPGLLGKFDSFRNNYQQSISLGADNARLEQLTKKINPFLLRRLKKDVLRELPPKIEQVSFCDMESQQKRAYAAMVDLARSQVMDAYTRKGFNKSRMLILTVLLRLRQICCHPWLAGVGKDSKFSVSTKLNLLKELLDEALDAGHRVLVFSQFVQMLDIIGDYLGREKISFECLDGRTRDREGVVERFKQGGSSVFLLSLKVGGVGLNLTSADTVILFEPWWNPAVESQAIDRAYRIGQDKQVMAYKLICKGTIEEKMLELQKHKKNLIDSLILSEDSLGKALGWEDVKFLLDI